MSRRSVTHPRRRRASHPALRRLALTLAGPACALSVSACGERAAEPEGATPADDAADAASATDAPAREDAPASEDAPAPPPYERPAFFPAAETPAAEVLAIPGLSAPVRVLVDDRGIPHIHAENEPDLFRAQGYVTARDRMFQMHTLRLAARGRLAELSGRSALAGDLYLRTLRLGAVAEAMAEKARLEDPQTWAAVSDFAAGVNAFLANLRAGREARPPEVAIFGLEALHDWTPGDTMAIVRLQTWDLSFRGIVDELGLLDYLLAVRTAWRGSELDGIWKDLADFRPLTETSTVPRSVRGAPATFDLEAVLSDPFYETLAAARIVEARHELEAMEHIPHRAFRASGEMFGSNNWVVSGAHTASGAPLLANDTHLALRNPSIFYQVHLDTAAAGGTLSLSGVNFAGAPGIVLGHNGHVAWGATVAYSDVTDVYVERFAPADAQAGYGPRDRVLRAGEAVPVERRAESFRFAKPATGACVDAAPAWVKNLTYRERVEGTDCLLEVELLDVPHHGPIIPWSFRETADGALLAMTFRWTGFEATEELGAIMGLNRARDFEDFKQALHRFGVGAQNWVYADTAGHIGWYPSHRVPIRKHLAAGDRRYPPFLPMPGDTGACEWEGFVPREDLPQAFDPEAGFLVTANADPAGFSFDNDPFNEGLYFGYAWDVGFRVDQIDRRLRAAIAAGDKLDVADMAAIQGDHRSRLGEALVPHLLDALDAARTGHDPQAEGQLTPAVEEAASYLASWEALGYEAASGVGPEPGTRAEAGSDAAKASTATVIFNAWVRFLIEDTMGDEGLVGLGGAMTGRFLVRLVTAPERLATASPDQTDHPLWDDRDTDEVVETRAAIMVRALARALAFLSAPDRVGPAEAGGFGTPDMASWRWGALHTVTLKHNISPAWHIPPASEHPNGFPRPGDSFGVDASDPGLFGRSFTFSSGAAIRNVYALTAPVTFHGVIPGGQSEHPTSRFYRDGADAWARNEAPLVLRERAALEALARSPGDTGARLVDLIPAP
jgi:penicillin amidase